MDPDVALPTVRQLPRRAGASPASDVSLALIGTFPPTECGIATYTANLAEALHARGATVGVVRVLDRDDEPSVDPLVVGRWFRADDDGPASVARAVEPFDALVLQHEFGIFPGEDGADVLDVVEAVDLPIVTVLHTVLSDPSARQRRIVAALLRRSHAAVVHTDVARARLERVHGGDAAAKVAVVPHGATPNLWGPPEPHRRPMILTWGLLGPGKGIEHGIEALGVLRRWGIEAHYVVAGETHPNVRAREGERYRRLLRATARRCGVDDLVHLDDGYRDWESLRALVRSATVVLLPYDSRQQVTSGVLVEALAAGKPVVATAFPHAVEVARTGAALVVRHGSVEQCAGALRTVLSRADVRRAMEAAARSQASTYDWANVAGRFEALARAAVAGLPVTAAVAG